MKKGCDLIVSKHKFEYIYKIFRKKDKKDYNFQYIGKGWKINGHPKITQPENIVIGDNIKINDGVVLNSFNSKIKIGNNVTLSVNSMIIAASYDVNAFLRCGEDFRKHNYSEVVIGDNVWIGAGAIILPNVKITNHVVVGAGSVVNKSISEEWVVVAGNPAIIVKRLKPVMNDLFQDT